MNFKILVTALVLGFTSHTALADAHGVDFPGLVEFIKGGTQAIEIVRVYDGETSRLDDRTIERLQEIAEDQANIWADTILEGDYFADGETRLDEVVAFLRGGEVVAYRVTYSERAWDTSECAFDGGDLETLFGCKQGRITESSFVSASFESYTRDMRALAEFAN